MNWRVMLLLACIAAALAAGIVFMRQQTSSGTAGSEVQRPDYTLHDFQLTTLKKDGSEGFSLTAPKLERQPDNREMNIATPTFQFPDSNGQRWQAAAQSAWVNADGSHVKLNRDVRLDNPGASTPVLMQTSMLEVFPNENRASSDAVVEITQANAHIRGRGLEARLDENRVTLQSEVRTRYAPASR